MSKRSQSYKCSEEILIIENTNTSVYRARSDHRRNYCPTAAVDAGRQPSGGSIIVSYGRLNRAWRVSYYTSRRHVSLMCPQNRFGDIKFIENTNKSAYRARSDNRRKYCTHRGNRWRRQPSGRSINSILRSPPSHAVVCLLLSRALQLGALSAIVPPGASLTKLLAEALLPFFIFGARPPRFLSLGGLIWSASLV